jgi:predicted amidohydrolase YtcJ
VTTIAIDEQIKQLEKISKDVDIRPLRWAFMHMEGVTPEQVERMKKLNMFLAINPRETVSGGLLHQIQGRQGVRHAAVEGDPGQRNHVGPGDGRI